MSTASPRIAQTDAQTTQHASDGGRLVGVHLIAWHNDGETVAYGGTCTVEIEDGELRIVSADITPVALPAGTLPLRGVDDRTFAFGPWDAAWSRNGAIIGSHTSGS